MGHGKLENLDRWKFEGVGEYDTPQIQPATGATLPKTWVPFNFARTDNDKQAHGLHCFVDDYQFIRTWNRPEAYVTAVLQYAAVCAPDFSIYVDMPKAMQVYNHYRKHWVAAYWQMLGANVIPTISWGTASTYSWCFDGEPVGGVVAVSSVGCMRTTESKRLFLDGYAEMMKRLEPKLVLFYGKVPVECDWNVTRIPAFYEKFKGGK